MRKYSQNDEQEVILKYFGDRKGNFLDIGAYNGTDLSNTRALVELGWGGLMVEPNPYNLVPLLDSVRGYPEVQVLAAAVVGQASQTPQALTLYLDSTHGRGWAATLVSSNPGVMRRDNVNLIVPTVDIAWLLGRAGRVDFISIDAEWMDLDILTYMPRDLGGAEMIIIEPSNMVMREQMKSRLSHQHHFRIHHETPENIIAIRSE